MYLTTEHPLSSQALLTHCDFKGALIVETYDLPYKQIMTSAVLFQVQSFLVLAIMTWGIYLRCQRTIHIKMMSTAIIWDILLICQIELTRGAINKATDSMLLSETARLILNVHVALALSSVVLYVCMIISGRKLLKGSLTIRPKHKILGWTTYVVRILTFITSFWAVAPKAL